MRIFPWANPRASATGECPVSIAYFSHQGAKSSREIKAIGKEGVLLLHSSAERTTEADGKLAQDCMGILFSSKPSFFSTLNQMR